LERLAQWEIGYESTKGQLTWMSLLKQRLKTEFKIASTFETIYTNPIFGTLWSKKFLWDSGLT
jgi:hypothetical protein